MHSPIVVAFGLNFTGRYWWVGASLSVVTALGLAIVMYLLVEKPSRRLASWVGGRASALVDAITAPIETAAAIDDRLRSLASASGAPAP